MSKEGTNKELWFKTDDGQSMCAMINGDKGWLMYLRYEGDAGFSSRNPNYNGDINAVMSFFLNSGQLDEYPMSWMLSIDEIEKAIKYFEIKKKPPTFITWYNDSEDGTTI